jgi:hypothetical protein
MELTSSMPTFKLHNITKLVAQPSLPALLPLFSIFTGIGSEDWNAPVLKNWIETIVKQSAARSHDELPKEHSQDDMENLNGTTWWTKQWSALIHKYIRWALMAGMPGPNGAETMSILGREETVGRFERARKVFLKAASMDDDPQGPLTLFSESSSAPDIISTLNNDPSPDGVRQRAAKDDERNRDNQTATL